MKCSISYSKQELHFKGIGKIIIESSKRMIDTLDLCFRKVFLSVVWKKAWKDKD